MNWYGGYAGVTRLNSLLSISICIQLTCVGGAGRLDGSLRSRPQLGQRVLLCSRLIVDRHIARLDGNDAVLHQPRGLRFSTWLC